MQCLEQVTGGDAGYFMKKLRILHQVIWLGFGMMVLAIIIRVFGVDYYIYRVAESTLRSTVEDVAGVELKYHKLAVGFIPPKVEIYDLEVVAAHDQKRLVAINYAYAQLSLKTLLLGRIQFKELQVDHVFVHKDNVVNFSQAYLHRLKLAEPVQDEGLAKRATAGSSSYVFSYQEMFQRIIIHNGRLDRSPMRFGRYVMDGTDFEGTLDLRSKQPAATLKLKGLRVQSGGFALLDSGEVGISLRLADSQLILDALEVQAPELSLSLNGVAPPQPTLPSAEKLANAMWWQGLQAWQFDGDISVDVALLGALLQQGQSYGRWRGQIAGEIHGADGLRFRLTGNGMFQDSMFRGYQLYDSELSFAATEQGVVIESLKIQEKSHHYATATGRVSWHDQQLEFQLFPYDLGLQDIYQVMGLAVHPVQSRLSREPIQFRGTFVDGLQLVITGQQVFYDIDILGVTSLVDSPGHQLMGCALDYRLAVSAHAFAVDAAAGRCLTAPSVASSAVGQTKAVALNYAEFFQEGADELNFSGRFPFKQGQAASPSLNLTLRGQDMAPYGELVGVELASTTMDVRMELAGPYTAMSYDLLVQGDHVRLFGLVLGSRARAKLEVIPQQQLIRGINLDTELTGLQYGYGALDHAASSAAAAASRSDQGGELRIQGGSYHFGERQLKLDITAQHLSPWFVRSIHQGATELVSGEPTGGWFATWLDELELALRLENVGTPQMHIYAESTLKGRELRRGAVHWLHHYHLAVAMTPERVQLHSSVLELTSELSLVAEGTLQAYGDPYAQTLPWLHPSAPLELKFATLAAGTGADVAELLYVGSYLSEYEVSTELSGEGALRGTLHQPQGHITLQGRNTSIRGGWLGHLRLDLEFNRGDVAAQLSLEHQTLDLRGNYGLASGRFALDAKMAQLNLMPFILGAQSDPRHYLFADSALQLKGIWGQPASYDGELLIKRVEVYMASEGLNDGLCCQLVQSQHPWRLELAQGRLTTASPMQITGLRGLGELTLQPQATLQQFRVEARGVSHLSSYSSIHPYLTSIQGQLHWHGVFEYADQHITALQLALTVPESTPGTVAIKGFSPAITDLHVDLSIDREFIHLHALRGQKGSGMIRGVPSRVALDGSSSEGLRLQGSSNMVTLHHRILGPVVGYFNYDLQLRYAELWRLTGEVSVEHMSSNRPLSLWRNIFADVGEVPLSKQWEEAEQGLLELDLRLRAEESIQLMNHPLSVVLGADLRLRGGWSNPYFSGSVAVAEGHFYYHKNYNITEGALYFRDSFTGIPNIVLQAESSIQGYEVVVDVSGALNDPKFQFFANPGQRPSGQPLSQIEIMYLMANDRLPPVGAGIDSQQNILISQAVSLAFSTVFDRLNHETKLDQRWIQDISIQAHTSKDAQGRTLRVAMPINTGLEDLNVALYGDPEEVGVKAEYDLNSNVVTLFKYSEPTDPDETRSVESAPSVGMKFRFSFP